VRRPGHWLFAAVPATAAFLSLYFVAAAAWIPLKAELAQWLLERSWRESLTGSTPRPPWPWADTHVAAELVAPAQDVRLLVLQGNSGRNLAFGPVLLDGDAGGPDVVINGHRDTHFRFLQGLHIGDRLRLSDRQGSRWYAVESVEIVDSRDYEIVVDSTVERLSLVTCFPFDSPVAGGPLRYVVTAYPLAHAAPHASQATPRWPSSA
jgi:sortase A